jgi:hypothetical protein
MNTRSIFSFRLAAFAVAVTLGLAAPAFASKNESHPENHAEGHDHDDHDDHGNGSGDRDDDNHPENHGSGSGGGNGSGGTPALRVYLAGTVEPGARGEAKLKTKTRGSQFEAEVKVPVPSTALALADKFQAREATATLILSRSGVPYAECDFDFKSFKRGKKRVSSAEYKIEINDRRGVLQERRGLCDTDLATPGAQQGLPKIQPGDAASVTIDTNGTVLLEGVF